jgi:hypothetical protein
MFCLLTLAQLSTGAANAQALAWSFVAGSVLSPDPAIAFMSQSIASPTVAWDSNRARFLMLFESRTTVVDPNCPAGVWAIGVATSPDGITWTPRTNPILNPTPGSGTYYQCVAAHPTMLYNSNGNGTVVGWFKAEQGTVVAPCPAWGCGNATGIGRVRVVLNAAGTPLSTSVSATPVWASNGLTIGFPKMTKVGNDFRMALQVYPDIWTAESTNLNSFSPSVALTVAEMQTAVSYAQDELFNPSTICNDDPALVFPNAMFVGARDTAFGAVVDAGWSKAMLDQVSLTYFLETTPQQTWTNNNEWRHFDVHKLNTGTDEYVVWFDEKDPATGNLSIRFGGTDIAISGTDLVSKVCP